MVSKVFVKFFKDTFRLLEDLFRIASYSSADYVESDRFELLKIGPLVVTIKNLTQGTEFSVPTAERKGRIAYDHKTGMHYWVICQLPWEGTFVEGVDEEEYQMRELRNFTRCDGPLPKTASFS